jgi:hypothetical protein
VFNILRYLFASSSLHLYLLPGLNIAFLLAGKSVQYPCSAFSSLAVSEGLSRQWVEGVMVSGGVAMLCPIFCSRLALRGVMSRRNGLEKNNSLLATFALNPEPENVNA